jgi:F420-0:gamma-glutamyl ligase
LNCRVLESAPCSVAILVDRCNNIPRKPVSKDDELSLTYDVAMIFLGGNDDREALTFAIRMAEDTRVRLSVVHLIAPNNGVSGGNEGVNINCQDFESTHDYMAMRDIKEREYIAYREVIAEDAAATASIVRSIMDEHELIVVGRRNMEDDIPQTAGLKEWCEHPELGVLGDLILSNETKSTSSLFVIQKQQQKSALN